MAACTGNATCSSWNFDGAGTSIEHGNCTLNTAVPPAYNAYNYYHFANGSIVPGAQVVGAASGVKGSWSTSESGCLTLDRPGIHAQAGNLSMCAASERSARLGGGSADVSNAPPPLPPPPQPTYCTAHKLSDLWAEFKTGGTLCGSRPGRIVADAAPIGATAVTMRIPAGGNGSATISMGWYFPHRDWAQSGGQYDDALPLHSLCVCFVFVLIVDLGTRVGCFISNAVVGVAHW